MTAELLMYYGVVCVQVLELSIPTNNGKGRPTAKRTYELTERFDDLKVLDGRKASLRYSPSASKVVVNGLDFLSRKVGVTTLRDDTAAGGIRHAMRLAHFRDGDPESRQLFDRNQGKELADYRADLVRLATRGWALYSGMFPDGAFDIRALMKRELAIAGALPVVQIIDNELGPDSTVWAAVYDLPLAQDGSGLWFCPSVAEFGPNSSRSPKFWCPHEKNHKPRGTICPWGFWGLSSILEQPSSAESAIGVVFDDAHPIHFLAIVGDEKDLDRELISEHLARLRKVLDSGASVSAPDLRGDNALVAALRPETIDVVYFYTHCGYHLREPGGIPDRFLKLKDFRLYPADLDAFRSSGEWPESHWQSRRPLVILNGCHTTSSTSGTLNSFVSEWQASGASGVLGTEIEVVQGVAALVGEILAEELHSGASVGAALRSMRWKLLARGNVLGLAYTPYSLASLTLRT